MTDSKKAIETERDLVAMSPLERALLDPEKHGLGTTLSDGFEEARVPRMWRSIEHRLEGEPQRRHRLLPGLVLAAAALVVIFALQGWFRTGPLELASGAMPSSFENKQGSEPIRFADGSAVALKATSQLEVLQNDATSFVTALRRGTGTFDIKPGGPRRWSINAGPVTVEVLGTRFDVVRTPDYVTVRVERGVVLVRAESLPDGHVRLLAGNEVKVPTAPEIAAHSEGRPEAAPLREESSDASKSPTLVPSSAPAPVVSASAAAKDPVDLDALLTRADAARARGDLDAAAAYLDQVVRLAPARDPRRGVAALSLARLTLANDPGRAAAALDQSMDAMPAALAEDALARQANAAGLAGDETQAAWLAERYLKRFPNGSHALDVKRWLKR